MGFSAFRVRGFQKLSIDFWFKISSIKLRPLKNEERPAFHVDEWPTRH